MTHRIAVAQLRDVDVAEPRRTLAELMAQTRAVFAERDLRFRAATESWHGPDEDWSASQLYTVSSFWLQSNPSQMKIIIETMAYEQKKEGLEDLRNKVLDKYETYPHCDQTLRHLIALMQHETTSAIEHEAHVVAFKQLLWQIKRHIVGMPVTWQTMVTLWSRKGGTGKSTIVDRLVTPIKDFTKFVGVDELNEKFSARMFASAFCCVFDELAGIGNVDPATFKTMITNKRFERRGMHSETGHSAENRLSCIATTNEPPPHGFTPEVGERRLWSIHCCETPFEDDTPRAVALGQIAIEKVWSAVSVEEEAPHTTCRQDVRDFMAAKRAENLILNSTLQNFIGECVGERHNANTPIKEFRDACHAYSRRCGLPPFKGSYAKFAEKLAELGIRTVNSKNRITLPDHFVRDEASAAT